MAKKQPLSFTLDEQPTETGPSAAPASTPKATPERAIPRAAGGLKQVGARIPESLYRELKAHAALKGEKVQTVLENVIADYLRGQDRKI